MTSSTTSFKEKDARKPATILIRDLQVFTWRIDLHGLLAAPVALIVGFVPGLGSLISYWTATEIWHWESWQAIAAFFWYYLPLVFIVIFMMSIVLFAGFKLLLRVLTKKD